MNTKLRKKQKIRNKKNEKDVLKLVNNAVFEETMENVRKQKTENRRNYLVLEVNYHTTKFFTEN